MDTLFLFFYKTQFFKSIYVYHTNKPAAAATATTADDLEKRMGRRSHMVHDIVQQQVDREKMLIEGEYFFNINEEEHHFL